MKRLLLVATISRFLRDFLLPYAQHFRAQGWQVDALCKGADAYPECASLFDHIWEINWSRNPLDPRNLFNAPRMIREIVQREHHDLVHVHTPVGALVTRYALRDLRRQTQTKVIYTAHGFHFHPAGKTVQNSMFLALERLASRWTDYLVVINREDNEVARRYGLVPPERLYYMPGIGVDLSYYNPHAVPCEITAAMRKALGISSEDILLSVVAEFVRNKRHDDVLCALPLLKHENIHLAFAGSGPEEEKLLRLTQQLGLSDRVHFLGFLHDIRPLVSASNALILPSQREGLPRCIMEALCLGIPVIGTDIRGTRELVTASCGMKYQTGDLDQLARRMDWIADHPNEARAMGVRGRAQMYRYELRSVIWQHEALYAKALGEDLHVLDRAA